MNSASFALVSRNWILPITKLSPSVSRQRHLADIYLAKGPVILLGCYMVIVRCLCESTPLLLH